MTEQKNVLSEANAALKVQGDELQARLKDTQSQLLEERGRVADLTAQNKTLSGQLKVESIEKSEVGEKLR